MKLGELPTEFFAAVRALKRLPARFRIMALYAADWWDDETLETKEVNGDLFGRPGELKPERTDIH